MLSAQLIMDRFVTRKRKRQESDEGESSGASSSDKQPVTNAQKVPESIEQAKSKEVNRKFNNEWEANFLLRSTKANQFVSYVEVILLLTKSTTSSVILISFTVALT